MILLSYDGSANAQAAIDDVARLMPGAAATVLTVWEPFMLVLARNGAAGMGMGVPLSGPYANHEAIDKAHEATALATAEEGVARATAGGLDATARSARTQSGIADTILGAAAELDADVIVVGTRGLSGVKSFLLGSVSNTVVHHADRSVLVVPDPELAERRRELIAQVAVLA